MKYLLPFIVLAITFTFGSCSGNEEGDGQNENGSINIEQLTEGFKNPPTPARAKVYWWWLNGNTDTVRMKTELLAIKNAGLGGVDIFEIGVPPASDPNHIIKAGPAFMGPESLKHIQFALNEAKRLDLEVGLGVASSWNAGGSWVEPKHAAKTVYYSKTSFNNTRGRDLALSFPEITKTKAGTPREILYAPNGKPVYYEEIAVLALPAGDTINIDTTKIIDVTRYFDSKKEVLNWDAPTGEWDIYRYICSNSGEQLIRPSENSKGPIIDHFDSSATRMHIMYFINRLKPLVGDFSQSALKYLYLASYEAKDFAWTPTLPHQFRKINGYDVFKFLPVIFNRQLMDTAIVEKFNHDFNETFSELMINNHYRKAKEICNSYGLKINSEAGGPGHLHHIPVETLKALGSLDIPRGEYWYNRSFFDKDSVVDLIWLVKEIAAASHIYKRGIVEEESFTSYWDWQEGPGDLKHLADRAFCEGMNRLVIHGFTHNPGGLGSPGIVYFAGTHFNDKVTWWPKVKPFNDYLARISYILQQTDFVSDVLYYYGENIPNLVPSKNSRFKVGPGYDYEVINTEILLNELEAKDGELVLPGVSRYKVLYVGNEKEMNPEVLLKLKSLAEKGAVIVGKKPSAAYGLNKDAGIVAKLNTLAAELWIDKLPADLKTGTRQRGKIYDGATPLEVLNGLGVKPDFSYRDQIAGTLDFIHYRKAGLEKSIVEKNGADFYLVRNTTDQWVSRNCSFRQTGKKVEVWDPVSGEIFPVKIFNTDGKQTDLPLSLPPFATMFIVFSDGKGSAVYNTLKPVDQDPPFVTHTKTGVEFRDAGSYMLSAGTKTISFRHQPVVKLVEGPWNLSFPQRSGVPLSAVFPALSSWTESEVKSIKYFSGTATYLNSFEFKTSDSGSDAIRVFLDLGDLSKVGEVWINDKPAGIVWTKPFRYDITRFVQNGKNTLRIEVANTWSNRLTGDAITGEKNTQTNIVKANKNLIPWNELPLIRSGLFGPVKIEVVELLR